MTLPRGYEKCKICGGNHKKLYPPDDWTWPENDREWARWHSGTSYWKQRMNYSARVIGLPLPYPEEV